jgi:hypothetical protein
MSEEKPPDGFTWGLRPGGGDTPEPEQPSAAERDAATSEPIDIGHVAVVETGELVVPDAAPGDFDDGEATAPFDFRAPEPPRIDSIETPVFHPGRSLPWEQPPAIDAALDGAHGPLAAEEAGLGLPEGESAPASALDALFGDDRFQPPEVLDRVGVVPFVARPARAIEGPAAPPRRAARTPSGPMPRSQRVLLWIAGGLVAALALAGLFFVGTRVGDSLPPDERTAPPPAVEEPAEPVEPTAAPIGPVEPGEHAWNELLGTECIDPFESAWQETYTVVDCAAPHAAQLVERGRLEESELDAFPGVAALQARVSALCASADVIDYPAAAEYPDIELSASFPGTEDDWADGDRGFHCFVSRASGEPFTSGVATPPRPPVDLEVVPAPEP